MVNLISPKSDQRWTVYYQRIVVADDGCSDELWMDDIAFNQHAVKQTKKMKERKNTHISSMPVLNKGLSNNETFPAQQKKKWKEEDGNSVRMWKGSRTKDPCITYAIDIYVQRWTQPTPFSHCGILLIIFYIHTRMLYLGAICEPFGSSACITFLFVPFDDCFFFLLFVVTLLVRYKNMYPSNFCADFSVGVYDISQWHQWWHSGGATDACMHKCIFLNDF